MIRQLPSYWFPLTITTQRGTASVDSGGGPVTTYATNLTLQARMNIPSGNKEAHWDRINGTLVTKWFINGNPAPDIAGGTDRIVYGTRVFDIKAVRNFDSAGVYLTIDTVEVSPSVAVL